MIWGWGVWWRGPQMHQDKLRTQTSQIHSLALAPCVRTEIKKNKETLDFKGKQTLWGVSNIQPEGQSRRKIKEVIIFGFLSWPRRQGAMPKLSFSYDGNISLQTTRKWKKRQWNPTHFIYFSLAIMDRIDWIDSIQMKIFQQYLYFFIHTAYYQVVLLV